MKNEPVAILAQAILRSALGSQRRRWKAEANPRVPQRRLTSSHVPRFNFDPRLAEENRVYAWNKWVSIPEPRDEAKVDEIENAPRVTAPPPVVAAPAPKLAGPGAERRGVLGNGTQVGMDPAKASHMKPQAPQLNAYQSGEHGHGYSQGHHQTSHEPRPNLTVHEFFQIAQRQQLPQMPPMSNSRPKQGAGAGEDQDKARKAACALWESSRGAAERHPYPCRWISPDEWNQDQHDEDAPIQPAEDEEGWTAVSKSARKADKKAKVARNQGFYGNGNLMPSPSIDNGRKIWVGNLHQGVSKEALFQAFSRYGDVQDVFMPLRSWAFVTFATSQQATDAKESCDRRLILPGSRLAVKVQWPRGRGSESNRTSTQKTITTTTSVGGPCKIFVGSATATLVDRHV